MITTIRLQNFRSYADAVFEFEPGVNIVVGPNASGKTNLLEAVMVLARGSSYRARDIELSEVQERVGPAGRRFWQAAQVGKDDAGADSALKDVRHRR